jgi:hypothetical protein
MWARRSDLYFKEMLRLAAHTIFQTSVVDDEGLAALNLDEFLLKERGKDGVVLHEDWHDSVQDAAYK